MKYLQDVCAIDDLSTERVGIGSGEGGGKRVKGREGESEQG